MAKSLLSVGLDVGTTSTQLIVSRLQVENQASSFAVPKLQITEREILYRSPVYFTPLVEGERINVSELRMMVEKMYAAAGITRDQVDTGAVIITGETSRKENAQAVLENLSDFAGDFVVATAGPDLESILAAKGAGAVIHSEGKRVLHMDIGGGTSNLCLCEDGKILATGCLNVGGRLLKFDHQGIVTYRSPVLEGLTDLKPGDFPMPGQVEAIAKILVSALEMAAGLRPPKDILCKLTTKETGTPWQIPRDVTLSFSGGVADCVGKDFSPLAFGDIGPILGKTIRESRLCQGEYFLAEETIHATVIGAGCHTARLSGSTVYYQNIAFPVKNIPVVEADPRDPSAIRQALEREDAEQICLAIHTADVPAYAEIKAMAQMLAQGFRDRPVLLCLQKDFAKVLGQCLGLALPKERPILCMDGLEIGNGTYLDVGRPVGPALPVIIKSLVFGGNP